MPEPIIKFTPPQEEVFWSTHRMLWMLWRRQLGKSFLFGGKALDRCMERADHMACFVSGSILMGGELIEKEAILWRKLIDAQRIAARAAGLHLTSIADDDKGNTLDVDAIADLFQHAKLECTIWHSQTSYSRTRVLSPNPATARGFSGDVLGDEVCFWPDFKATMDAIEPIISRRPDWIMWLASSPPADDTHPTFEILQPQRDAWPANARGNWYQTNTEDGTEGFPVHRCDANDGILANVPLYSLKTAGKKLTIEEAMSEAIDKESFRRNYLLQFIAGGSAALGLQDLIAAQQRGRNQGLAVEITDTLFV
ncbi:terminase large subunit domain-containing protein [Prosthecobacter dejongeii]|uniref:Uncharacterized protein n=1 Tax=Prosthecobacter dejongeii TaxID=48465 RepID=A0A7W8DP96_9BACT|nr:terminase family protein [Prosthecobacter dejongeii]MBB5037097.1 hypothetical protein [Prosthecobacter dejongeii]